MSWFNNNRAGNCEAEREDAIDRISAALWEYQGADDASLAHLTLWIVVPREDQRVLWAGDNIFKTRLINRLNQEEITAIKEVEVVQITMSDLQSAIAQDNGIKKLLQDPLIYFKTRAITGTQPKTNQGNAQPAWLKCIDGIENLSQTIFCLDPQEKDQWHIGRMKEPKLEDDPTLINDIVINDNAIRGLSRAHAIIFLTDGCYYIKAKRGGGRHSSEGIGSTTVIRGNGRRDEFIKPATEYPPLEEGDTINLSDKIVFEFTYVNPDSHHDDFKLETPNPDNGTGPINNVDDSF